MHNPISVLRDYNSHEYSINIERTCLSTQIIIPLCWFITYTSHVMDETLLIWHNTIYMKQKLVARLTWVNKQEYNMKLDLVKK